MKVHVGKYTKWIGPYQIAEFFLAPRTWFWDKDVTYNSEHEELCHKWGERLSRIKLLEKACHWIERKKKRKIKIQIDPWDTWSMDHTLSMIILPMLKQLKATNHGAPFVEAKDVPAKLRPKKKPSGKNGYVDDTHHERWEWVMDEMIWTFEQLCNEDNTAQFHSGESEILFQALDKNGKPIGEPQPIENRKKFEETESYQMVRGPNDTSAYDHEGHQKHNDRIANGLRLFGTYYRNLWD
jgi:hypothetical protein